MLLLLKAYILTDSTLFAIEAQYILLVVHKRLNMSPETTQQCNMELDLKLFRNFWIRALSFGNLLVFIMQLSFKPLSLPAESELWAGINTVLIQEKRNHQYRIKLDS